MLKEDKVAGSVKDNAGCARGRSPAGGVGMMQTRDEQTEASREEGTCPDCATWECVDLNPGRLAASSGHISLINLIDGWGEGDCEEEVFQWQGGSVRWDGL